MPVDIHLRPSRVLQCLALALILLSFIALFRLPLPLPIVIALGLVLVLYCYRGWQQLSIKVVGCITRLSYQGDQWLVQINGEQQRLELSAARVWQTLVSLEFRQPGCRKRQRVVLLADNCDVEQFRRLRVLLRHFPVLA